MIAQFTCTSANLLVAKEMENVRKMNQTMTIEMVMVKIVMTKMAMTEITTY